MNVSIGGRPNAPLFALKSYDTSPGWFACSNGLPFGLSWILSLNPARYLPGHAWHVGFYLTGHHGWCLAVRVPTFRGSLHLQIDRWSR